MYISCCTVFQENTNRSRTMTLNRAASKRDLKVFLNTIARYTYIFEDASLPILALYRPTSPLNSRQWCNQKFISLQTAANQAFCANFCAQSGNYVNVKFH